MSNHEGYYRPSLLDALVQKVTSALQLWFSEQYRVTRRVMVGVILTMALLSFELFNFDTTEYALENLLGTVSFAGVRWATILAIAFCGIDFAGLARLLTPDDENNSGNATLKPSWLLMGAWLLGGGMNAIMTWWSISLTLMDHNLGNEVLSRAQLIHIVPIFVAVLVWLTRILIISSFIVATDKNPLVASDQLRVRPRSAANRPQPNLPTRPPVRQPVRPPSNPEPVYAAQENKPKAQPHRAGSRPPRAIGRPNNTVKPRRPRGVRRPAVPMQAKGSSGHRRKLV